MLWLAIAAAALADDGSGGGEWEYHLRALRLGRVVIGSQPSLADLERLQQQGVRHVINLRTDAEMADRREVPYDEPAALARLGLAYTHLPMGDAAHPPSPALVEAFDAALRENGGDVLLHCQVGHRAGLVWAAHAVRHGGLEPTEALRALAPLGLWPMSLERLLGRPLAVEFAR